MKLMLKNLSAFAVLVAAVFVIGCSQNESEPVPTPRPLPGDTGGGDLNPGNPNVLNPDIPSMINVSVPVELRDSVNFSAIADIASDFAPDLVGDPRIAMALSQQDNKIEGSVLFSFEDQFGFWGALINTFGETGRVLGNIIDLIFADDELVLRTIGTRNGDTFDGVIHYRVRQSGDTACKPVFVYCDVSIDSQNFWLYPSPEFPEFCNTQPNVDAACYSYMNTSNAEVKELGAFSSSFSSWVP